MTRLSIRIDLDGGVRFGPGKARLLQLVAETGSIAAAARAMEMSYARAWRLIDELKAAFGAPLVEAAAGGKAGGSARLTSLGREALAGYRAVEAAADAAARAPMRRLARLRA